MTSPLFSEFELEARRIMEAYRVNHCSDTTAEIAILNVFRAMYSHAIPYNKIVAVSCAINGIVDIDLAPALNRMVKYGTLRKRVIAKTVVYEVAV